MVVRVEKNIPRSYLKSLLEKVPLLMAMYSSSVLIGISTYLTFPFNNDFLRYSVSIVGGAAFDVIMTATVFSDRKNKFSILTILAALITGLALALDLYLQTHLLWLHAFYVVMGVLFALHLATTRGYDIHELEIQLQEALELLRTKEYQEHEVTELQRTIQTQQNTITDLRDKLEYNNEGIIERLSTLTDLSGSKIRDIVRLTKSDVLERVKHYRGE